MLVRIRLVISIVILLLAVSARAAELSNSSAQFRFDVIWATGGTGCGWASDETLDPIFQVSNLLVGECMDPWAINASSSGLELAYDVPFSQYPYTFIRRGIQSSLGTSVAFEGRHKVSIAISLIGQWKNLECSVVARSQDGTESSFVVASEGEHTADWGLEPGVYQFFLTAGANQEAFETVGDLDSVHGLQASIRVTWEEEPPLPVEYSRWGTIKALYR